MRPTKKQRMSRKTRKGKKRVSRKRRQSRKQRGGAFSIESIAPEYEHDTIVTIRPDALEEDSIPLTTRLTTARRLLEETDTGA